MMSAMELFIPGGVGFPLWPLWMVSLFIALIFWEIIWKGIALWKSARSSHKWWFVFILILNTAGLLPIIYLLFFQKKVAEKTTVKAAAKRKK